MLRNYYFLVSGLTDLVLGDEKTGASFSVFMDEISELIHPSDLQLLQYIRLPFDNLNLITVLLGKNREFDLRGNYSRDDLVDAIKNPDVLPAYMQTFLEMQKENKQLVPGLVAEDQLSWLFYDEIAEHKNVFVRSWFEFDKNLRNVIAGINCRKELAHIKALASERESALASVVIGNDEVAEAVLRSNAADFGLSGILPWVEKLIHHSQGSLQNFEREIDLLRWEFLNEITVFSYFGIESILVFTLKLLIVERWKMLDPQKGRERLEMLVEELKAGFSMPVGF
ncbi:MAG: DUF2764 family protein [Fibrobacter sp.]|nr:DUF2764 family protein [Fibrobacter sp.]